MQAPRHIRFIIDLQTTRRAPLPGQVMPPGAGCLPAIVWRAALPDATMQA